MIPKLSDEEKKAFNFCNSKVSDILFFAYPFFRRYAI